MGERLPGSPCEARQLRVVRKTRTKIVVFSPLLSEPLQGHQLVRLGVDNRPGLA